MKDSIACDSVLLQVRKLSYSGKTKALIYKELVDELSKKEPTTSNLLRCVSYLKRAIEVAPSDYLFDLKMKLMNVYMLLQGKADVTEQLSEVIVDIEQRYIVTSHQKASFFHQKAVIYSMTGEYERALEYARRAHKSYEETNDVDGQFEMLRFFGNIHGFMKQKEEQEQAYVATLDFVKRNKLNRQLESVLYLLANCAYGQKKYNEAIGWCDQVLEITDVKIDTARYYRTVSIYYSATKNFDKARYYTYKIIEDYSSERNRFPQYRRLADLYVQDGMRDSAIYYYEKTLYDCEYTLQKRNQATMPAMAIYVYTALGELAWQNKEIDKAISFLEIAVNVAQSQSRSSEFKLKAYRLLNVYYLATGQPTKAMNAWTRYDSLYTNYEILSKEQRKEDLARQLRGKELSFTVEEQRMKLEQTNRLILLILVICLFSIVILFGVFMLYRQKKRLLNSIEQKDKEIKELSKKTELENNTTQEAQLFERIEKIMIDEQLFMDKDLNLDDFSKKIGSNRSYVSAAINQFTKQNFSQWVNRYRVGYFVENIIKEDNIQDLALRSGFASQASFYRWFKVYTGMTPKQYIEKYGRIEP
ncbi:MAG: helix-turn-helix domain-containing protein [Tannerellaceae bacterium]